MINPANYYNPFAKYNYVSKTRGVYFPKETQTIETNSSVKASGNIYSANYSAEADIMMAMNSDNCDNSLNDKLWNWFNKVFPND